MEIGIDLCVEVSRRFPPVRRGSGRPRGARCRRRAPMHTSCARAGAFRAVEHAILKRMRGGHAHLIGLCTPCVLPLPPTPSARGRMSPLPHTCCYAEKGGCRGGGGAQDAAEASRSASLAAAEASRSASLPGIRASPPSPAGDARLSSSFRGFLASWGG